MNHRPAEVNWPERDRFFLSKGHACPVVYSVMARSGYFPVEELLTLRKCGTRLQGHPSCKTLPGIEVSSGSLGQGLSVANGFALSAKLDKKAYPRLLPAGRRRTAGRPGLGSHHDRSPL